VRGPEQSRPFGELVDEVEALARRGTFEVTLLGQNVNSYGRDLTTALRRDPGVDLSGLAGERASRRRAAPRPRPLFADLLRAVGAVDGIRRVRFTSPHPKDLRPRRSPRWPRPTGGLRAAPPAAAVGQRPVLRAMRRGYTAERYLERLGAAAPRSPTSR
jgi:tRNA-2-methylthio-N6-dimethylallyladenosine synthase